MINLHKSTEPFEFDDSNWFGYEKPSVLEAFRVLSKEGYYITISGHDYDMRKKRLEKEYEENTKAPGSGEDQSKEGNPALKEAASQFNDALLDELRKKIAVYKKLHFYDTKTLKRKDEIIEELRDKNAELLGMVERMKEDVKDIDTNLNAANKTNKCLNKKVVELTKIKGDLNSWISGLYFCIHHNNDNYKYKLKRLGKEIAKLNSIIHDKNAVLADVSEELRLTKIREKNLAELGLKYVGENEKLKKELADKVVDKIDAQALKSAESALAYKEKMISEKDEVIADLGKELAEAKKLNTAKILDINAKCMRAARESINDVFESYAAKYAKSTLDELKDKAYETFNAKAHKLGLVGSKDGKGIPDQMIRVDIAEEGGDHSGVIVLCGTDFVKMLTENEDFIHDLFGKKHKEIKEFMSAEAEQLFEGDGIPTKMEVMKPSRKFKKIK